MAAANAGKKKRKSEDPEVSSKKRRTASLNGTAIAPAQVLTAGKIQRIFMRNFMCHDALQIQLNPNVNFIIGRNGSGKSAILTALTVGLGARAHVTSRGGSVKEFIKKGKTSAIVEVTIANEGPAAYKPDVYGKSIKVVRTIGSVTKYQLKNGEGKTMSTKREELERMLNRMNIQVDNPISILNQDVSRSFLTTSSPADKYSLFIKATRIADARDIYKEAQQDTDDAHRQLGIANARLVESKKEVEALERSMKLLESVESTREEVRQQELELRWATAIEEESKLHQIEKTLAVHTNTLEDIESETRAKDAADGKIGSKLEELSEKIRTIKSETSEGLNAYVTTNERFQKMKEMHTEKKREWMTAQAMVKRTETDVAMIKQEIKRLEGMQDGANERAQRKEEAVTKKKELEDIEAMLRTKQNEHMHFCTDKIRLEQEERTLKIEVQHHETAIRKMKQQLMSLRQQSDSAVTVFGSDMPRLLKRIDEEYKRGRFKQKPVGPFGAYIKIKEPDWTPAVESYLGKAVLSAFAVDNGQDSKHLGNIMNELFRGQRKPTIYASQFFNRVHDVSQMCVHHPKHKSLFDMMEISHPVVSNCLIDQLEPECCLLIPTNAEASEMLSDRRRVPRGCKRGLTLSADEYFPDPQYRSYGGKVGRPKFLQVSAKEAIASLEEELGIAEQDCGTARTLHRNKQEKLKRCLAQLNEVSSQVAKLQPIKLKKKTEIDRIADQLDLEEPNYTREFIEEMTVSEKKLAEQKEVETRLRTEVEETRNSLKDLEVEVKRLANLKESMDSKINKIKDEIRNLEDEREMFKRNHQRSERKLTETRQAMQKVTAELEVQKRVTEKATADAEEHSPRIETKRSVAEIKRASSELKAKIRAVEQRSGSKDEIERELDAKRKTYDKEVEKTNALKIFEDEQLGRLRERTVIYKELRTRIGKTVQTAFTNILKLRNYGGELKINHSGGTLDLEVTPRNTEKRTSSDARTLSGGERSYSTVAFILALWECTGLPFYFLDEFDVFMDKVNRRIIIDILLDHTRNHPESQFVFLTPLDTSIVQVDDYLTIHQLAPPERGNFLSQQ